MSCGCNSGFENGLFDEFDDDEFDFDDFDADEFGLNNNSNRRCRRRCRRRCCRRCCRRCRRCCNRNSENNSRSREAILIGNGTNELIRVRFVGTVPVFRVREDSCSCR